MPKVKRSSRGFSNKHAYEKVEVDEGVYLGNKALYIKGQDLKTLLMQ